ncbi:MAG: RNA methyltransferase [Lachnospiraceae bacterium]|nr:RNA methyltransferase [Lachnospiraceae bacterium]
MNIIHIENLYAPELDIFARISESQLLHYYEPKPGLFIAESPNVILRALESGYQPVSLLVETERLDKEAAPVMESVRRYMGNKFAEELPIYTADRIILKELTGYALVRGLWGAFKRKPLQELSDFCKDKNRIAILHDIVNPTNVGAITRSAAALGMDGLIITYDTVNPLYRRSARVSMGTVFQIPWTVYERQNEARQEITNFLKDNGYMTVAMALTEDSLSVNDERIKTANRLAIILGTEGYGLPDDVIRSCDHTVKIPMYHGVDSLNVAAASAVCFWELSKE